MRPAARARRGGLDRLPGNLDRVAATAADHGTQAVLHVGTLVETGTDPAELTRQATERIARTHLKDVDLAFARKVQDGRLTYTEAVRDGMYRPLSRGDVDIAAIVKQLDRHRYAGRYTVEQDTILTEPPRRRTARTPGPASTACSGCSEAMGNAERQTAGHRAKGSSEPSSPS